MTGNLASCNLSNVARRVLRPGQAAYVNTTRHIEVNPMIDQKIQQCIQECLDCYKVCLQTSMNQCLESGGKHVEPEHFRLMSVCADICRTSAEFMLCASPLHTRVCAVCAEICDACAQSCAEIGGMDECVESCRRCAQSCHQMSSPMAAAA